MSYDEAEYSDEPRSAKGSKLKIILPVLVLLIGAGTTAALFMSRTPPQRVERPNLGPLVEVEITGAHDVQVEVRAQGEVRARTRVELMAQVSGRIVATHPALESGGRFRAGDVLARIDTADYALAVERASAAIARAEVGLEREQAEAAAAIAEWRELEGDREPPSLLARKPQIGQAEAELLAAKADLGAAQLNLERTRLTLPFDGVVVSESVDIGQFVSQGRTVATAYGIEEVEVRVPLADGELAWFEVPGRGQQGPTVDVYASIAGQRYRWQAELDRLEGEVDARSRMIGIVVTVPKPFAGSLDQPERPPLLPGTFVDVVIEGQTLEAVVPIPRHALRNGDRVWVAEQDQLRIRSVDVARRERERVLVAAGLSAGEKLVVSSLDAATDGMTIRVAEQGIGDGAPAETANNE